jgi:hypothetical protein
MHISIIASIVASNGIDTVYFEVRPLTRIYSAIPMLVCPTLLGDMMKNQPLGKRQQTFFSSHCRNE